MKTQLQYDMLSNIMKIFAFRGGHGVDTLLSIL